MVPLRDVEFHARFSLNEVSVSQTGDGRSVTSQRMILEFLSSLDAKLGLMSAMYDGGNKN